MSFLSFILSWFDMADSDPPQDAPNAQDNAPEQQQTTPQPQGPPFPVPFLILPLPAQPGSSSQQTPIAIPIPIPPNLPSGNFTMEFFIPEFALSDTVDETSGADRRASPRPGQRHHPYIRVQFTMHPTDVMQDINQQGQPPAAEKIIAALKKVNKEEFIMEKHVDSDSVHCTVCMDDLFPLASSEEPLEREEHNEEESVVKLPCLHLFHHACISEWLSRSNTCPTCRYELPTANKEYNVGVSRRMRDRARARCAMVGIACDEEEQKQDNSASLTTDDDTPVYPNDELRSGEVLLKCGCRFHDSCLRAALRVAGYDRSMAQPHVMIKDANIVVVEDATRDEAEETEVEVVIADPTLIPVRCPRCRRPNTISIHLLDESTATVSA